MQIFRLGRQNIITASSTRTHTLTPHSMHTPDRPWWETGSPSHPPARGYAAAGGQRKMSLLPPTALRWRTLAHRHHHQDGQSDREHCEEEGEEVIFVDQSGTVKLTGWQPVVDWGTCFHSLVSKLRGTEEEPSLQYWHGHCHRHRIKVFNANFSHLWQEWSCELLGSHVTRNPLTTSSSDSRVTLKMSPCSVWTRKKNMCWPCMWGMKYAPLWGDSNYGTSSQLSLLSCVWHCTQITYSSQHHPGHAEGRDK